ncbi:LysE family translocator [Tianweitania sediminis]|uniref:LysE family translocator n=1 Tax=Tianweitania sediminis TaxID=1502156 RepID=A0A8J7R112_9HYPH|nr:LysE family translocator [Tianweitania sediminis]MBP0439262.1 LysE family translocator [Tianweitania sediminis]
MSIEFILTTLIIVASPGTGAVYTIAAGLSRGSRASIPAAFACTLGIVPHMVAALTGLAALLHTSALLFEIVKYAGVAYLLYMAWQTLKERGAMKINASADHRSAKQVVIDGVVLNILNPKLSIFFVAFLPQFIAVDERYALLRMLELSAIFMVATFVIFALYGLFAAALRARVIGNAKVMAWMRRTFAAAFVALGAKLALTER